MDGFKRPSRPMSPQNTRTPVGASRPQALDVGGQTRPAVASSSYPSASAQQQPTQPTPIAETTPVAPSDSSQETSNIESSNKTNSPHRKKWPLVLLGVILLTIALICGVFWWYNEQLKPVSGDETKKSVVIADGDSTAAVARKLKEAGLIRDENALQIYMKLSGKSGLQAGSCRMSPSQTTPEIVDKIIAGCHDFKTITFYPGGTLEPSKHKASRSNDGVDKSNARYILKKAGFSDQEITEAFRATYSGPLFADKPANSSLEGYIFGETYYVAEGATAQQVLETVFSHMYQVVQKNDLVAKFKAQGLNLYQGLTMASIVERELTCEDKPTAERKERCYQYQRGIAQVFIKRYKTDMQLGSDITAVYAADHTGIAIPENDTSTLLSIDSPYNTRKHTGLTPTPIAAPGELSLKAVANPTDTDNLYFLAGDDGLIYFAKTNQEHEANIKNHCQKLCAVI